MVDIAGNIRKGLKKNGMNASQLAKKMNVARSTVSQWLNGHSTPPAEKLIKIISILDIADEFFPKKEESIGEVILRANKEKKPLVVMPPKMMAMMLEDLKREEERSNKASNEVAEIIKKFGLETIRRAAEILELQKKTIYN